LQAKIFLPRSQDEKSDGGGRFAGGYAASGSHTGLDGFATTRKINGELGMKGVPIIFVTSKDQKADRVFAQMLGAKGYVTKPYSPEQILAHIA
jgi:CheY-like chemotaxis protein